LGLHHSKPIITNQNVSVLAQEELQQDGLPECDAVVNLAGENIGNPLRRYNLISCCDVSNPFLLLLQVE
jgi:NAD dependent epimerase/dehydratase family enzyme